MKDEDPDQIFRVIRYGGWWDSDETDLALFLLELNFTRKCTEEPRRNLRCLNKTHNKTKNLCHKSAMERPGSKRLGAPENNAEVQLPPNAEVHLWYGAEVHLWYSAGVHPPSGSRMHLIWYQSPPKVQYGVLEKLT